MDKPNAKVRESPTQRGPKGHVPSEMIEISTCLNILAVLRFKNCAGYDVELGNFQFFIFHTEMCEI